MVAAGPYTVRAYDIGAESGGHRPIGQCRIPARAGSDYEWPAQAVAFFDAERRHGHHSGGSIAGMNGVTLRGAGFGLTGRRRSVARQDLRRGAHRTHAGADRQQQFGSMPG